MMSNFQAADILYFRRYFFTDTNTDTKQGAPRYALVLLPSCVMGLSDNLLCCVITSQPTTRYALKLPKRIYDFLSKDSFCCFDRRDINSIHDLDNRKQSVGRLTQFGVRRAFGIIKAIHCGTPDLYLMATVVREWKKIK